MAMNTTESWVLPHGSYTIAEDGVIPWLFTAPALLIGAYCISFAWSSLFGYKVPVFGVKSLWEPIMVSNYRFFRHAETVLEEGYRAVSGLFKVARTEFRLIMTTVHGQDLPVSPC